MKEKRRNHTRKIIETTTIETGIAIRMARVKNLNLQKNKRL
jgi:hypothetical protein